MTDIEQAWLWTRRRFTPVIHPIHHCARCQQRNKEFLDLGLIRSVALTVWYSERQEENSENLFFDGSRGGRG